MFFGCFFYQLSAVEPAAGLQAEQDGIITINP